MAEEVDPRNVSRSGIRMMEEMEKRGLEDWHKVLFEK